jgi:hypothetical protein
MGMFFDYQLNANSAGESGVLERSLCGRLYKSIYENCNEKNSENVDGASRVYRGGAHGSLREFASAKNRSA